MCIRDRAHTPAFQGLPCLGQGGENRLQVRGSDWKGSWRKKKNDDDSEGKNRDKQNGRQSDEDSFQNDREKSDSEKNDDEKNGSKEKRGMILSPSAGQ